MLSFQYRSALLMLATVLVASVGDAPKCHAVHVLRVSAHATVHKRSVQATDLIKCDSTTSRMAKVLAETNIAAIPASDFETKIRTSSIRLRLVLAGWERSDFRIEGPDVVVVRYQEATPLTDADIEIAAAKTMQRAFGGRPGDVRSRLTRSFMESVPVGVKKMSGLRVEVLEPDQTETGQLSLPVRLWDGPNLVYSRAGRFSVSRKRRVAVFRVSMERETTIDEDDVRFEERFLTTPEDEPQEEDVYGQRVRKPVKAGQLLSLRDLKTPAPKEKMIVVKSRDRVEVSAISGRVRIRTRQVEALESGRVGDVIRLRNLKSKKEISGRVVGPGVVEIRL